MSSRAFSWRKIRGLQRRLTFRPFPGTNPRMRPILPPCPHLPPPRAGLDWRTLHAHRDGRRKSGFYLACLEYGHDLWRRRLAARAILCLDRAFGADLRGREAVLRAWPLPYAALVWLLQHTPPEVFLGNPRVHFQHYAGRMNAPRREQRVWRAWACWALTRAARPEFPGDPRHRVAEPAIDAIAASLRDHGHAGEAELWLGVLESIPPAKPRPAGYAHG
jgi:hypothetical protein